MGVWNLERVNRKTKCYGLDTGGDGNDSEKHHEHFEDLMNGVRWRKKLLTCTTVDRLIIRDVLWHGYCSIAKEELRKAAMQLLLGDNPESCGHRFIEARTE